jgi:hypothetical protein
LLAASVLAGILWDRYGSEGTFVASAALTALAGVVALVLYAAGELQRAPANR